MTRTLLDGTTVPVLPNTTELRVVTKCPQKYKLVDMETGEEYIGTVPDGSAAQYFWEKINA